METEIIDKLFLELSQISTATTLRESELLAELTRLRAAEEFKKKVVDYTNTYVIDSPSDFRDFGSYVRSLVEDFHA